MQALTSPNWSEISDRVSQGPNEINHIGRQTLQSLVAILEAPGNWERLNNAGHLDKTTNVRHIRPSDLPDWKLPRAIEICDQQVYVIFKGGDAPRRGIGAFKIVSGGVRLNDLKPIVQATIKLQDTPGGLSRVELIEQTDCEIRIQRLFEGVEQFVQILGTTTYPAKAVKGDYAKTAILMEDCEAGELFAVLQADPPHPSATTLSSDLRSLTSCVTDMLVMLATLEDKRILNRDIKEENLFFTVQNGLLRLKMSDFGFSSDIQEELVRLRGAPFEDGVRGSPEYLCPDYCWTWEDIGRRSEADLEIMCSPKTDVWSMGVVLFDVMFGQLPDFAGGSLDQPYSFTQDHLDEELHEQTQQGSILECLNVGDGVVMLPILSELCARMLRLDPAERPLASQLLKDYGTQISLDKLV